MHLNVYYRIERFAGKIELVRCFLSANLICVLQAFPGSACELRFLRDQTTRGRVPPQQPRRRAVAALPARRLDARRRRQLRRRLRRLRASPTSTRARAQRMLVRHDAKL
jgi:hypothetical protein